MTLKDGLATLWAPLSIFIGAWTAFFFNNRRTKLETIDKEVTNGNLALSVLSEFLDQQLQYQKNYIEPHKSQPDAWFRISMGPPLDTLRVQLDRHSLGFLLEANGRVWQQVILEERRFFSVNTLIGERNALLAKAHLKMEGAGVQHGASIETSELETILGPVLFRQLNDMGSAIILHIALNTKSALEAIEALRRELVRNYPGRKFISVDYPIQTLKEDSGQLAGKDAAIAKNPASPRPRKNPAGKYLPHERDD